MLKWQLTATISAKNLTNGNVYGISVILENDTLYLMVYHAPPMDIVGVFLEFV